LPDGHSRCCSSRGEYGERGDVRRGEPRAARAENRRRIDLRGFLLFLPNGYESYARRNDPNLVIALRSVVVVITPLIGAIGSAIAAVLEPAHGPVAPWLALLSLFAISNYATCRLITTRPLDCASDASLAAGYISSVCLRITFATSLALFAYTFAIIAERAWLYAVGAVSSLLWLWSEIAPTGRTIARDQRRISSQGCDRSLVTPWA
jgi:hypothetical protein